MCSQRTQGFTLIELMVTVAMIVIVLAIGIPAFKSLQATSNRAARINELVTAIQLARSEAVKRRAPVSIVPNGGDWATGWKVFLDQNGNRTQEAGDTLLRQASFTNPAFTLTSAGFGGGITFDREGAPNATGSFTFTQDGATRTISINATGRPRIQ